MLLCLAFYTSDLFLLLEENVGKITTTTPLQRRHRAPSSGTTNGAFGSPFIDGNGGTMDQFDSLKREATKLERSLEDKVSRYQQVRFFINLWSMVWSSFANSKLERTK